MSVCASCSVLQGECPDCGTFWVIVPGGKRHGLTPVAKQAFDGPTSHLFTRNQLGNFIERPVTEAEISTVKQRLADTFADYYLSASPGRETRL